MKKILSIVCLALVLSVNTSSANAQAGRNTLVREVVREILTEIASEAARELLRSMFAPRPEERRAAFSDGEWLVTIGKNGDDFTYYGVNLKSRASITLRGANLAANSQRHVYTWNNGDYRYQVAWRPSDPQVIRLQVFNGREELLNRLLYKA